MRKSGILMPISSLPSQYGIGSFSKEAYEFVDFLDSAGQKIWQILPLCPTGYGDSPYQSASVFAGNPYFINLEELIEEGLLTRKECNKADLGKNPVEIDYEKLYKNRLPLLRKAYENAKLEKNKDFQEFCKNEAEWLDEYALYMAIKDENDGRSFLEWPDALRFREKKTIQAVEKRLKKEILFYCFLQYLFFKQWTALKKSANNKGIEIVGDIPIYVALDSADTWMHPELFQLDENGLPIGVAGCPPDYFSKTGQLWGNPLYDWTYHKETSYSWWMQRLGHCYKLYDVVRIDHFRGFDEYYFIPYGDPTAEFGHWEKGPGYALFETFRKTYGKRPVIAEDLGLLTKSVKSLIKKTGYPGMKILEFAFDSDEENDYLPHNFDSNCVVYTGTHDNDTVLGWYQSAKNADKKNIREYLGVKSAANINWDLIRLAEQSVADTAIIPIQDCLGIGKEGRMNLPSTLGTNWKWRMQSGVCTPELAAKLYRMSKNYGRV